MKKTMMILLAMMLPMLMTAQAKQQALNVVDLAQRPRRGRLVAIKTSLIFSISNVPIENKNLAISMTPIARLFLRRRISLPPLAARFWSAYPSRR